jgi:hypothetical protein
MNIKLALTYLMQEEYGSAMITLKDLKLNKTLSQYITL